MSERTRVCYPFIFALFTARRLFIENVAEATGSSLLLNFSQQQRSITQTAPTSEEACSDAGSRENSSNAEQDRGIVAALRIEERILNEKLGLRTSATPAPPNSSTNSTSSVISSSNSPPRSTPLSLPPSSSSPVSESVSTTPTGSFCRAPGLGPVTLPEGHSGTQLPLVCPICGFSCNSKFHYNSHMNTHGDHQCTMCDYTSRTEGRLKKHMRDSHTAEEQMAAGLDLEPSSCASATATPIASTTLSTPTGVNLATTMASVLEAANLAAAAQVAAARASNDDTPSSVACNNAADTQDPSSTSLLSMSVPTTVSTNGLLPSALDQIRAFTENRSILPDLSSTNLATALMSHGLLGNAPPLSEPSTSSFPIEEPAMCSVSAERRGSGGKPKTYKCKQCNHVSASKEEQWTHARTHIPVEKQLGCTRCGFVTEYKHHLEYHLRNHMGSKPFHCKKCAYSCVNKSMLNSHMKSHTNIYQFRCRDCTYATKYCHSLKLHLKKYNHNRAGDANEATVINGQNANNFVDSPFEAVSESDTLRRLSESYSINGGEGRSPSPQTSIPQSLANAINLSPIVTSSSLNLASQLLLRQHQVCSFLCRHN
ncbi:unnamed protein product [Toxocara canis]|uniref:Protein hunchback n=1 Tax=Toxocara canis TaxID=6265 RepID=A0A183VG38_TOXCA|nr:unnamed protein product [Toxocara canis]